MISEKKDLDEGSSSCSNTRKYKYIGQLPILVVWSRVFYVMQSWYKHFACWSHKALSRISASLIVPFELAYMNQLQLIG